MTSRSVISAHSFLENIDKPFENVVVEGAITLSGKTLKEIKLRNCEVSFFLGDHLECESIYLEDCKIRHFQLNNCSVKNIQVSGLRGHTFWLTGSQQKCDVWMMGAQNVILELEVSDFSFEEFKIYDGRFRKIRFARPNGSYINIGNLSVSKNLRNEREIEFFQKNEDVKIYSLGLSDINQYKIEFKGSKFEYLSLDSIGSVIRFEDTDLGDTLINGSNVSSLRVSQCAGRLTLQGGNFREIFLFGNSDTDIKGIGTERAKLTIERLQFYQYTPERQNSLSFTDCDFNELVLSHSNFVCFFQLNNVYVQSYFLIHNSNLGRSYLNNVEVNESCDIQIFDSDIIDAAFSNFKWNSDYRLSFDEDIAKQDVSYAKSVRESYRQLKANFIKSGNKIEALEFQKHEMSLHYLITKRQLLIDGGNIFNYRLKRNKFIVSLGNFLTVWTHKASSQFGQNIIRPLFLLLLIHLAFFNLLLCWTPEIGLQASWSLNSEAINHGFKIYCQTLLPIHTSTVKSVANKDVNIAGFWDLLIRISSSYFIFYFLAASRKYHQ